MIYLPLYYCDNVIGKAMVDDENEAFTDIRFGAVLPKSIRKLAPGRPDVLVALFLEDTGSVMIQRCRPYTSFANTQILLAHMVLNPDLASAVLGFDSASIPSTRSVSRIVYRNSNRCDCRLANLSEIPLGVCS